MTVAINAGPIAGHVQRPSVDVSIAVFSVHLSWMCRELRCVSMMYRPLILSINAVVIIIGKNLYLNYEQPLHSPCEDEIAADKIMYLCLRWFTFRRFDFNESIAAATRQARPNKILL